MSSDRDANGAGIGGKVSDGDCVIRACEGMVLELSCEGMMSAVIFCDDEEAAGIAIDTVNDSGAQDAINTGEGVTAMGEEGVHEGTVGVTWGGMDDHTGWFIHDEEVSIFEDDIERDFLGEDLKWLWIWD